MKTVNKKRSKYILTSLITASLLLSACSGGGDSTQSSDTPTTPEASTPSTTNPLTTGTFVDDPVIGLNYECEGGIVGVTNDSGEYACPTGEDVTFSLGSSEIGTLSAQTAAITPYSLFPNDEAAAINLARLLQTVDDGSVKGKLKLDSLLKEKIPATLTFTDNDFTTTAESALGRTLVDEATATENMDEAILLVGGKIPDPNNYFPIANAGEDILTTQGSTVTLSSALSSDADGDSLTYAWKLTLKPSGSSAALVNADTASPSLSVDVDGRYVAELVVNDGTSDSSVDSVRIHTNVTEYNKLTHSVTTGDSDDTLTVTKKLAKGAVLDTGAGADTLDLEEVKVKDVQILTGAGADTLTLQALKDSVVDTGADNDTLTIASLDSGAATINTGSGADTLNITKVAGGYDDGSVDLGEGDDTLNIEDSLSGTDALFDGGEGNDTLNLPNVSLEDWNGGVKDSFINFENITLADVVNTYDDSGVVIDTQREGDVNTGDEDDVIYIKKLKDTSVNTKGGNDSITVKKVDKTSAVINAGADDDNVTLQGVSSGYDNGTVNLGSGNDRLVIEASLKGVESTFDGGDGYDIAILPKVKAKYWKNNIENIFTNFEYIEIEDGEVIQMAPLLEASTMSVDENTADGTSIGNVTILDEGATEITSMTLSGEGHENFSVNTDGNVSVVNGANLDYETTTSYTLLAQATNTKGSSLEVSVLINVNDIDENTGGGDGSGDGDGSGSGDGDGSSSGDGDGSGSGDDTNTPPLLSNFIPNPDNENKIYIGEVQAVDADGDDLVFSLTGVDAEVFIIAPTTGLLSFRAEPSYDNPLDVGLNNIYDFTIVVTDTHSATDTKITKLKITDSDRELELEIPPVYTIPGVGGGSGSGSGSGGGTVSAIIQPHNGEVVIGEDGYMRFLPGDTFDGWAEWYIIIDLADGTQQRVRFTTGTEPTTVSHGGFGYNEVVSPETGRTWLDRNLGASKACDAVDDEACYGDYYQWGRDSDGHEKEDSSVVEMTATDVINPGTTAFIFSSLGSGDWSSVDTNGLIRNAKWMKTDGTNVCPTNYRVPTVNEIADETVNNGVAEKEGALNNFLKLGSSGYRNQRGEVNYTGEGAYIWSSTIAGNDSRMYFFNDTRSEISTNGDRGDGHVIRCIKEEIANTAPVANEQNISVAKNSIDNSITLTATDAEGDDLTYSIVSTTTNGTLTLAGNVATYTPNTDSVEADSFTFTVNDGSADSIAKTVDIRVYDESIGTSDSNVGQQVTQFPGHTSGSWHEEAGFAALKKDGSIVSWGGRGSDSSSVASSLTSGVKAIYSNNAALAALKEDGSVITWGSSDAGGDSSSVAVSLTSEVKSIYSSSAAFAALKEDGSVITWGESSEGGDSLSVATSLTSGVKTIYSTFDAMAALKEDGSVLTWGNPNGGGDSSSVAVSLTSGVKTVSSTEYALAALKEDGSVITWGSPDAGGDSSSVAVSLTNGVKTIYSTWSAFAALKEDGSVITWGDSSQGGDSSSIVSSLMSGVKTIYSTADGFAALKEDGSVVTWGDSGGDSSSVAVNLTSGVKTIYSNHHSFAALKEDGSVVTWGGPGGDSSSVAANLTSGVKTIYSTNGAFAALKEDGSVVTWGSSNYGGDSSSVVASLMSGIKSISSTYGAFAALKEDGNVVTWGHEYMGGDSSSVASDLVNVKSFSQSYTWTEDTTSQSQNTPPVADAQSVTVAQDSTNNTITLTATDAEGDSLTYSIVDTTTNGTLTLVDNVITYTPTTDFSGEDTFTFKANDGSEDSETVTVTITVTPTPVVVVSSGVVKKTGQTTSYTTYDDGHYQTGATPSYTRDDVNAIVTDEVTGLMWQDNATPQSMNWENAGNYCSALTLGSYTDWELPTRKELVGLSDYGRYAPAIDPVFENTLSNAYWSSTTNAYNTSSAWIVSFYNGNQSYTTKTVNRSVRCVRGGQ